MLSPWIIRTLTLPPLLAPLVSRNFRRYHKPFIYLPQNSHLSCISIAIPRYIAMQLSTVPFIIMTYFTFVILPLHDHVVDIVFLAKPPCIIFIHVTLDSLHHPGTPPEAFIQSHILFQFQVVIHYVVINKSVMIIIIRALSPKKKERKKG